MTSNRSYRYFLYLLLLIYPFGVGAGNIDPDNEGSQYAWAENLGWINFKPLQGPGVTVSDTTIEGYAWGENIGWINLSPTVYGGIVNDGAGNLSGYAWTENAGWINFRPIGSGVLIDPSTGVFEGWAWGENIGWINFGFTSPGVNRVKTSWRPQPAQQACDVDANGIVDIYDIKAIAAARNTPAVPGDVRDVDGDGVITLNDARQCVLQCTNPRCAP